MPTATIRLDHVAYPSFDVAATHRFYREILRLPLLFAYSGVSPEWGDRAYLMMGYGLGDGGQVVFFGLEGMKRPPEDGLPKDIRHAALTTESTRALAGWKRRLSRHGVSFWEEDHGTQRSIYFSDPNGVLLEITSPSSEVGLPRNADAARVVAQWVKAHPPAKSGRKSRASR
jgi:catechol 2,3-dioxygenase-like lactoylglutathione lyase family enzyme